jgi:GT2 family glycosyltransferase
MMGIKVPVYLFKEHYITASIAVTCRLSTLSKTARPMIPEITFHPNERAAKPVFSIIIPSWNNLSFLTCCINSIKRNSSYDHQIIVHVNEGTDGTLEWVKEQHLDYSYSPKNAGVCYGFNAPSRLAKSELLLLSDDDFYYAPGWDVALAEEVKKINHRLFSISGTMIEPTPSRNTCALAPFDFGSSPAEFDEAGFLGHFEKIPFQDWSGSNWYPLVLHRDTWEKIGGLSVEFSPGMGSDPDMMLKLWQAGVRYCKGVSRARVYHFRSKTTGRIVRNNGNRQFLKKWNMSISTFYKYYLKMGMPFAGELKTPSSSPLLLVRLLRDRIKKIVGLS